MLAPPLGLFVFVLGDWGPWIARPANACTQFPKSARSPIAPSRCEHPRPSYTSDMAKKTTLNDIAAMLEKQRDEIKDLTRSGAHVVEHMASKEQVVALHTQVNSIEAQLRQTKAERRLADLEEKIFGTSRA